MQTILIVDDIEINREMLASFFEEQYNILEAADGDEAISIINENKKDISLIFLDLIMPKKDGIDVLIYLHLAHPEAFGSGEAAESRCCEAAR